MLFGLARAERCGHHRRAMSMNEPSGQIAERWLRLAEAALRLGLTEPALRARLARSACNEAGQVVSRPGLGVEGRKLGAHWRVRLNT